MAKSEPTGLAKLAAEFLGTFVLVFTVTNAILGGSPLGCLSIACSLMVSIYAMGSISGGNFNPAVTLGLLICGHVGGTDMNIKTAVSYWCVQLLGGFFGVFFGALTWSTTFGGYVSNSRTGGLELVTDFAGLQLKEVTTCVFFSELLFTALLVFVVLSVATTKDYFKDTKDGKNYYFALAIGFTIVAGATATGAISGCSLNPAVSFGVTMGSLMKTDAEFWGAFQKFLLYAFAELLGGGLAFGFFNAARPGLGTEKLGVANKAFAEFLGTFYLVLTVAFVVHDPATASALGVVGIASALMVVIYSLGAVSGGNFNPAVSTGLLLIGALKVQEFCVYVVSQLLGGFFAVLLAKWLLPVWHFALVSQAGHEGRVQQYEVNNTITSGSLSNASWPSTLATAAHGSWGAIVMGEMFYTFLLVFVVLNVAVGDGPNQYYGLAIGFVVITGGYAVGKLTGGCFNPAISFSLDIVALWTDGAAYGYGWIYIICQLAAGAIAALVYRVVRATTAKIATGDDDDDEETSILSADYD